MTKLRVILAADEAAGARTVNLLQRSDLELVAIAAKPPADEDERSLFAKGRALGLPCFDARRLGKLEMASELARLQPDVFLNVHSLTKVCAEVLEVFPVGAWNLHPGPLPEGAGINVPSWAIALGWSEHGVSLHRMTAEYDEGGLAYEDRFPIAEAATGLTLSAECGNRGLRLVKQLIDQLAADPAAVPDSPQDLSRRGYYGKGQPNDGVVDWSAPAAAIEGHVRAADFRPFESPWHAPRAEIDGGSFELVEVAVGEPTTEPAGSTRTDDERISVAAADRWITLIEARKVTS